MEEKIKVSVIIPVYQVEQYLERAVDSVLAQTMKELEIILVDDGSEDASGQICDCYARAYPQKIRVIHKENELISKKIMPKFLHSIYHSQSFLFSGCIILFSGI